MTCPDDPAAFLRNAMRHHADHLEPREDDIGKLKRKLAIMEKRVEEQRLELVARRFAHPEEEWHPPNGKHDGVLTYNGVDIFGE